MLNPVNMLSAPLRGYILQTACHMAKCCARGLWREVFQWFEKHGYETQQMFNHRGNKEDNTRHHLTVSCCLVVGHVPLNSETDQDLTNNGRALTLPLQAHIHFRPYLVAEFHKRARATAVVPYSLRKQHSQDPVITEAATIFSMPGHLGQQKSYEIEPRV